jgi:hypothetical protein
MILFSAINALKVGELLSTKQRWKNESCKYSFIGYDDNIRIFAVRMFNGEFGARRESGDFSNG